MKRVKFILFLTVVSCLFMQCKPDKEDYTDGWIGAWQTTDETKFPQTKYLHEGTIIKNNSERNNIIMSGTLLGINSSYKIPIRLSSENRGNIDYTNGFTINGSATFNRKDTIWLRMNISQDNKTERDTVVLVKVK